MTLFEKGNKYAYGNPTSGRPATWTDDIIEKEAALFVEWAQLETSVNWTEFGPRRGFCTKYLYEWAEKNEVFREASQLAKDMIRDRRQSLALDKMIPRYAAMYDDKLDEFEDKKEVFKSKLRQKEAEVAGINSSDLARLCKAAADKAVEEYKASQDEAAADVS